MESWQEGIIPPDQKMFCHRFRDRIYQTVRELADPIQIAFIETETGIPADRILMTKCGYICKALEAMMDFKNKRNHSIDLPLSSFYGYLFDFEGLTEDDRDTGTDHEFIVMYDQGWWLIDSYLGCRELTCRKVDPDLLLQVARELQEQFNEEIWIWLTGCHSTDDPTARTQKMRVVVTEFEYTRI